MLAKAFLDQMRLRGRRWSAVPPLAQIEGPSGLSILGELPSPLSNSIWHAYHLVESWVVCAPEHRAELFDREAAHARRQEALGPPEVDPIREPLEALWSVVEPEVDARVVGDAAAALADWAGEIGAVGARRELLHLAAACDPGTPAHSLELGRLERAQGNHDQAFEWFAWAAAAARREGDATSLGWAHIGEAHVHLHRGSLPSAREKYLKALRMARREGISEIRGAAAHSLASLAIEMGEEEAVDAYVTETLRVYRSDHPRLPILAHDIAYHWLCRGDACAAVRVLRAIDPGSLGDGERLLYLASCARAEGAVGNRDGYTEAAQRLTGLMEGLSGAERLSAALLEMARGAASLGMTQEAVRLAGDALDAARELREHRVIFEAEALLGELDGEKGENPAGENAAPRLVERLVGVLAGGSA
jgi:tetratricopeptide (TPR) repeat protein